MRETGPAARCRLALAVLLGVPLTWSGLALAPAAVAAPPEPVSDSPAAVSVLVPPGTLAITTPWTSSSPLDLGVAVLDESDLTWSARKAFGATQADGIQILDRRAGEPSTTATLSATPFRSGALSFPASHLGLLDLSVSAAPGSQWLADDVTAYDVPANVPGLDAAARTILHSPGGHPMGAVWLAGGFDLSKVPSSVRPGTYVAVLTFSAF